MKIKTADRVLLILFMILSVGLLCIALNIVPLSYFEDLFSGLQYTWPVLVLSLVLLAASLRLLFAGFSRKQPVSTVLKTTDLGMIRVSVITLDTLTQKAVRSFQEVREVRSAVFPEPDGGVRIRLKVTILPDVPMPELTQNIQGKVKEYVEELSGIAVKEVQVYIENLSVSRQNRVE